MLTERYINPQHVVLSWMLNSEDFLSGSVTGVQNTSGSPSDSNVYATVNSGVSLGPWSYGVHDLFKYEFSAGTLDLPQIFGRLPGRSSEKVIYHPGLLSQEQPPGFDMFRRRGDNLFNALQLLSSWNFRSSNDNVPGEHSVVHSKFVGDVHTGIPTSLLMRDESNDYNRYSSTLSVSTDANLKMSYSFSNYYELFPSRGLFRDSYSSIVSGLPDLDYDVTSYPGIPNLVRFYLHFSDWSFGFSGDFLSSFSFKNEYYYHEQSGSTFLKERASTRITVYPVISLKLLSPPLDDGDYSLSDFLHHDLIVDYEQLYYDQADNDTEGFVNLGVLQQSRNGYSVGSSDWYRCQHIAAMPRTDRKVFPDNGHISGVSVSTPASGRGVLPWNYNEPNDTFPSFKNKRLKTLKRDIEIELPDLYSGLVISQARALDAGYETLEINLLESIGDTLEIRSLIDGFGSYRVFLKKLSEGKADTWSVLDLLTDYNLLYKFGIAPTIDDAKKIADHGRRLALRYRSIQPTRPLYGQFDFDFDDWNVTFRTKVVVKQQTSTLLAALLPARAAGLVPNLQNVWNLVRFSFVADWFFNIDDRLAVIDNSATLLLFDIDYVVSSIKVTRTLPSSDYESYGFSPSGSDGVVFSYYCRMMSDTLLRYGKTKHDFLQAKGPTDITVAASLVYKLVR